MEAFVGQKLQLKSITNDGATDEVVPEKGTYDTQVLGCTLKFTSTHTGGGAMDLGVSASYVNSSHGKASYDPTTHTWSSDGLSATERSGGRLNDMREEIMQRIIGGKAAVEVIDSNTIAFHELNKKSGARTGAKLVWGIC